MYNKHPFHGAHGRLTYDLHDKNWMPHIGINNPSNCKVDTKNKGIMFFDWKIQPKKIQLTRDLKVDTEIYQGIRLLCKNYEGYCDPTTRTQATIVWSPEDTSTTFQVAKIHARMIQFYQKNFIESISYNEVNPEKIRQNNQFFQNISNIEIKLTRFQIYPETELACKFNIPLYKLQYSENLVEYKNSFDMNTGNLIIMPNLTHHISKSDKNSYIPVTVLKIQEELVENLDHKTKAVRAYNNYHLSTISILVQFTMTFKFIESSLKNETRLSHFHNQTQLSHFHSILTITQILTTTYKIILTEMHYFPPFHGPHTIS